MDWLKRGLHAEGFKGFKVHSSQGWEDHLRILVLIGFFKLLSLPPVLGWGL